MVPAGLRIGGVVVAIAAVGLMAWAITAQRRAGTHPSPLRETTALVITGPYAWSRNPMYVANLGLQAGIGLAAGWLWAVILLPGTMFSLYWFVIRREERQLESMPGYPDYRKTVRRWL